MKKKFGARLADLTALLLSLFLALIVWVNAQQTEDPVIRRALQIPVELIGQPEDVKIIQPGNSNVTVLIAYEGPTSIIDPLTARDFTATADLSQVELGRQQTVPIEVRTDIDGIAIDPPAPSDINVFLEQLISDEIPVELDLRGNVPRGYTADEALVDPEFINVTGIASDVNELALARVTVFLGNNNTQTKLVSPQPIFYDHQGRVASVSGLDLNPSQVQVTIPINEAEDFANKVISVNIVGDPAPGYRLLDAIVEPPSVLVTGRPSTLEQPFRVETEPIDITGLTETFQTRVTLILPDGITLDEVQEIVATVEIEPISSIKVFNRPVELQGVPEELEATIEPENVRVVLFGPLPVLDALPEQEVLATLDLFGLDVGDYEVEPVVTIPERGLEIRSIQPSLINVNITHTMTTTNEITGTQSLTETSSTLLLEPVTPPRYPALINECATPVDLVMKCRAPEWLLLLEPVTAVPNTHNGGESPSSSTAVANLPKQPSLDCHTRAGGYSDVRIPTFTGMTCKDTTSLPKRILWI
ncbi:MAG: hypothetical protein GY796_16075 [Chloroflexi bacterium]|nr:hypothetical protein [Chloroflexota bacterium]